MEQIEFMGIRIDNLTMAEAMQRVRDCVTSGKKMYAVTPNVDHIVKLQKDARFREAYAHAGMVTVDGTPIMMVGKLYGTPFKEKLPGPKLAEEVVALAAREGYSVFFLGAAEGVGKKAGERMTQKYPGLYVAGAYSPPYGFEKNPDEIEQIITNVNAAKPDIIIAGMGSPKTELFLMNYYEKMDAKVSFSTGAAIDFLAGEVRRCPAWVNKIGMEWFYRFLKEPKRLFKRYFVDDTKFLLLIFRYWKKQPKGA